MIPANLSLVPFSPERRAAMEAIAEVERRRSRGAVSTMDGLYSCRHHRGRGVRYYLLCHHLDSGPSG